MTTANEYTVRLSALLRREHDSLADFLVELSEFDSRHLWRELGYANLFDYLHRELGLSRGASHYRRVAAELVRRYPEVLEPLRDGRLCFSSVLEVAKVITPENRAEVLPRFFHRSKAEAKAVAVEIKPVEAPPRRDVVTAIRSTPMSVSTPDEKAPGPLPLDGKQIVHPMNTTLPPPSSGSSVGSGNAVPGTPSHEALPRRADRPELEPLTADLARLHVTVSKAFLQKLARARDTRSRTPIRAPPSPASSKLGWTPSSSGT